MDLSNPFEVVLHHLLIGGMTDLGHWDEVLIISALVCTVSCWARLTMSHDIRLLSSHDIIKMLYYIVS